MIGQLYSGYWYVAIAVWIFAGVFNLVIDTRKYKQANMNKERKVSRVLGWFNVWLGIALFIGIIIIKIFV